MASLALAGEAKVVNAQGGGRQAYGQVGRLWLVSRGDGPIRLVSRGGGPVQLGFGGDGRHRLCRGRRSGGRHIGSFRRQPGGHERYVTAQKCEQPVLIPACPGFIGTRLVVTNFGSAHAVIHIEEKLDVEGGIVLVRFGRQR